MEYIKKGCVYFFRHIGLTPIKIGFSANESPIDRLSQFNTYAPFGAELLGFIQTERAEVLESKLHKKYSNKRLNGEWFDILETDVLYEIKYYSSLEDIRLKNEFEKEWALRVNQKNSLIKYLPAYFISWANDYVIVEMKRIIKIEVYNDFISKSDKTDSNISHKKFWQFMLVYYNSYNYNIKNGKDSNGRWVQFFKK